MESRQSISLWSRYLKWLDSFPKPVIEESISLRIAVQAMVVVGIIATDVAADTQMSVWAIPLSIVGGIVSWIRRRKRNIGLKFLIAIGMLLSMGTFFGNLFGSLNDTRLVLAELLIQLQVLHSFDLPRRKDLGYSMVIGLILIGVAATLAETVAIGPCLLIFLAIALPTLVLDYRSRLGLKSQEPFLNRRQKRGTKKSDRRKTNSYSPLSPKRLSIFLGIIVALGLVLFAFMPRFPGYQQFTFPVTTDPGLENREFDSDNRRIFGPGVREGDEDEESNNGQGEGGEESNSYYGFDSQIDQSQLGEGTLTPQVVMRVRSQAPGFWRVVAFDRYTGQGWEISRDDKLITIDRPYWSYRFFLSPARTRGRTNQVIQTYTIVSPLTNLLPALTHPRELYFPTPEIAIDLEDSLRAPINLTEDLTYTIISQVPYRDRAQLSQTLQDYPEKITENYLQVPPEIQDKVRQTAEQLLAKANSPITSPYEKALFIAQSLKQNYQIPDQEIILGEGEDLVESFLYRYQGGYPDHFSTVLTIMLRSIGIPARLVAGFAPGEFNPFTGFYIVRNTDAYAMTEVYFPGYGWFTFDPIPGHELTPASFEESQTFSVLKQFWNWVAGWLPSPVSSFLSNLLRFLVTGLATILGRVWGFVSSGWTGFLTGAIGLSAFGWLGWIAWQQLKGWRYRRWLSKLHPMEQLYQQMLKMLATQGYPKHPAQTPLEYSQSFRTQFPEVNSEVIDEIAQSYVRWRYGAHAPNLIDLKQQLKKLRKVTTRV